jgi:hydrogenase maturation factor
MNGIWRSANYAFAPNFLQFCGPDKNRELKGYLQTKTSDAGLKAMLKKFAAMHPYFKLIADQNGIADEFDNRIVEAYWLGNELLEKVSVGSFFNHIRPRLPKKELKWFEFKLPRGAKPNHQFHVFNFIIRTGHRAVSHTAETMDNCRISSGVITGSGQIKTDQLIYKNGKLVLKKNVVKPVKNVGDDYQVGDLVTVHWGWICEKISPQQAENLERYTRLALNLANQTI